LNNTFINDYNIKYYGECFKLIVEYEKSSCALPTIINKKEIVHNLSYLWETYREKKKLIELILVSVYGSNFPNFKDLSQNLIF
jgi:hypothetical protein